MEKIPDKITYFPDGSIIGIELPECFTFPFNYHPHRLTKIAVAALQDYLETQTDFTHDFGFTSESQGPAIGKMFGVLVVLDKEGKLGYLSAFSGKLAGSNHHARFVPPVFDMLDEDGFFVNEIRIINAINQQIRAIENGNDYRNLEHSVQQYNALSITESAELRQQLKINKANRKQLREEQKEILSAADYSHLEASLVKQSLHDKHLLTALLDKWEQNLREEKLGVAKMEAELEALKNERKQRSAALQQQLFDQYEFLNRHGIRKSLQAIFSDTTLGHPPAAAGECATPKLLQYAFLHGYQPVAMAEFWWGISPKSEIRQHKQFYPACAEKCKPILGHMLEGMVVDGGF